MISPGKYKTHNLSRWPLQLPERRLYGSVRRIKSLGFELRPGKNTIRCAPERAEMKRPELQRPVNPLCACFRTWHTCNPFAASACKKWFASITFCRRFDKRTTSCPDLEETGDESLIDWKRLVCFHVIVTHLSPDWD